MKLLMVLVLTCGVVLYSFSQTSVYNFQITGANAQVYPVNDLKGQKIMIVILPVTQTIDDSSFMTRIDSIAQLGQFKIIAVPSNEDGFTANNTDNLMHWYQAALDASIIISQPIYTHQSSGTLQDNLFSWLTHSTQNNHFDYEIKGPFSTLFVNAKGELTGVFGPEAKYSNKVLQLMQQ